MGIMDRVKWNWDKVAVMTSLLEKWRPRNCKTEKDYENNLYLFLHRELEGHIIEKQAGHGRFHADLIIDNELVIEIKYDLNTTAKYQRLKGQMDEYKKWPGNIILLLIGKTDLNFKKQLLSFLKEQGLSNTLKIGIDLMSKDKVTVIEKA